MKNLSQSLINEVQEVESKLKQKGYNLFKLESIFSSYEYFLKELQQDYNGTLDDYLNDLSIREILEEFSNFSGNELKQFIKDEVQKLDEQFISLTESSKKLTDFALERKLPIWIYRKPKKIVQKFVDLF